MNICNILQCLNIDFTYNRNSAMHMSDFEDLIGDSTMFASTIFDDDNYPTLIFGDDNSNIMHDISDVIQVPGKTYPYTGIEELKFDMCENLHESSDYFIHMYKDTWDILLPVENCEMEIGFVSVKHVLEFLSRYMVVVNGGLMHSWIYKDIQCYALLDKAGYWRLYVLAPRCYTSYDILLLFNEAHVHFIEWDEKNYMYDIMINPLTDAMIPSSNEDVNRIGSTFKDISYCKIYLNTFVKRLYDWNKKNNTNDIRFIL